MSLAIPAFTLFDQSDHCWRYMVLPSYGGLRRFAQLDQVEDFGNVGWPKFSVSWNVAERMFARMGVGEFVLKIVLAVIPSIFIFVVNVVIGGAWSKKCFGNQCMDHARSKSVISLLPLLEQVHEQVTTSIDPRAKQLPISCVGGDGSPSVNVGNRVGEILDVAKIANLVQALISRYVAELFNGMIGAHQNLQFCCQAQDATNVAGQFLLGYCTHILSHLLEWSNAGLKDFEHFGRAWMRRRADLLLEASKP